jgi:hypothetical protein
MRMGLSGELLYRGTLIKQMGKAIMGQLSDANSAKLSFSKEH